MKKFSYLLPIFAGLFVVVVAASHETPRNFLELTHKADSCYMASDFQSASQFYGEALKCDEAAENNYYNAICCAAKANDCKTAFARFKTLLHNYPNWYSRHIETDVDLVNLHADKRWSKLVKEIKARQQRIESTYEHPLYEQLMAIWNEDQNSRNAFAQAYYAGQNTDSAYNAMCRLDTLHMQFIDSVIDSRGWLGKAVIGDATSAVWLVVQHYGMDKWQKYLPMFRKAVEQGDLQQHQVDLLENRIKEFSK